MPQMLFYRLLSWLPFRLLYGAARLLYLLIYHVAGYRKEVVMENLRHAFPDKSETEITVLAKSFYRQLAEVSLEILKVRRMSKAEFRQRVRLCNPELLADYSNSFTKSVIVMAIHQGNWEWMLHGATSALGVPVDPVYKPLHNQTADRLMLEMRGQFGARPIAMQQAARDILRNRKNARILAMVADQAPIRRERSYWTTFMHRDAAFYLGAEKIAKATGFPILFARCRRLSQGHYEIEFQELARPPYDSEKHDITERFVRLAEEAIRQEPQSWLWSNRRWKRDRESAD